LKAALNEPSTNKMREILCWNRFHFHSGKNKIEVFLFDISGIKYISENSLSSLRILKLGAISDSHGGEH
jgi:hypothetical protein